MGTWTPVAANVDHTDVVKRYKAGEATKDIADTHGVGIHIIYKVLKLYKINRIKGRFKKSYIPHNKSDISDKDIVRLHDTGLNYSQIASELQCPRALIRSRSKTLNLPPNKLNYGDLPTNLKSRIGDLAFEKLRDKPWLENAYVNQYKTTRVIADELGCGKKVVTSFLRRHNIPVCRNKRGIFKSSKSKCKSFWFDSYWEYSIACKFDSDHNVIKFIKDPFPIAYYDGEKFRNYMPDFLIILLTRIILVEVKPDGLLPYVEHKTKAARNSGFDYYVINDKDDMPWI